MKKLPTSIIIFGASGDLTKRKLIPSFFNLFRKRKTPKHFNIIGYGWTPFTDEQFREHLGGRLTITLPDGIGGKTEVHQMDPGRIEQAIDDVRETKLP